MGSKQGSENGVLDFGELPKMVAPRQFCFDTLHGRGPRSARGPSGGHFPKWGPKNGVQHGVQNGSNMGSKMGTTMGPKMGSKMGSKQGSENGVPDFGELPKMVAPRQFCFDTLDGRGPRLARGPSGGHFPKSGPNWDPKMESKMEYKNGVQITVQNGLQNWGPKWDPNMGAAITTSSYHHEQK